MIYYFLAFFVEGVILWQYARALFLPSDNHRKAGLLPFLYLFLFFISTLKIIWLNTVLFLFVNFIYLHTQYRLGWLPALFYSAVLTAVMSMCELMLYGIISCYSPHFLAEPLYPPKPCHFGDFQ